MTTSTEYILLVLAGGATGILFSIAMNVRRIASAAEKFAAGEHKPVEKPE